MARGDDSRFVVTSLDLPSPECVYRDRYCAPGQDENFMKMIMGDLCPHLPATVERCADAWV